MKKINIISDAVYARTGAGSTEIAGKHELGILNEGALVAFTDLGATIADGASPTLTDVISMHVGSQPSVNFNVARATMTKQVYIAAVDSIDYIGYNTSSGDVDLTTPFKDGDSIGLMIHPAELTEGDVPRKYYNVPLLSTTTINEAVTALVAKINADPNSLVTALKTNSGADYGVKLTSKGRNIGFSLQGLWVNSPVTHSTNFRPSFGSQADIQKLVDDNAAMVGARDGLDGRKTFTDVVVPAEAGGFVVYTLNHFNVRDYPVNIGATAMKKQHVFVVPTSLTDIIADMDGFAAVINA